jgi:hypothetical protein
MTMKTLHMPLDPAVPAARPKPGLVARIAEWVVDDAPSREEARRRIRSKPGFFASLSPEARAAVLSDEGPDYLSPPLTKRNRRFLLEESRPAA